MYIEHLITKHKHLYTLGNRIIKSTSIRNNFFNMKPNVYSKYEERQQYLVQSYINETNDLNMFWKENNKHMNLYLLRDYGSNKINFEKK